MGDLTFLLFSTEFYAMYKDLSSIGIYHNDIRYSNILLAPQDSPLIQGVSPFWTKPYQFRLIDFHKTVRSNVEKKIIVDDQCNDIYLVLRGLAKGKTVEP